MRLCFTETADKQYREPESGQLKRLKAVRKALALLEVNPRHPSLHTHKYSSLSTKEYEVFEAYAENKTPAAYRIFFRYGPPPCDMTILAITPYP